MKQSTLCQKISAIPGIGAMTATAIVAAVGDAREFKNGRHLAAWIGLVPRQHSTGGKSRLLGISKHGGTYLRIVLINGARSVLIRVACKKDTRSRWLQELIASRGYNRAAVPDLYASKTQLRTLQRRVKTWRTERAKEMVLGKPDKFLVIHYGLHRARRRVFGRSRNLNALRHIQESIPLPLRRRGPPAVSFGTRDKCSAVSA